MTRELWTLADPLEGDPASAALKTPERALVRNLGMLSRHLTGSQIVIPLGLGSIPGKCHQLSLRAPGFGPRLGQFVRAMPQVLIGAWMLKASGKTVER